MQATMWEERRGRDAKLPWPRGRVIHARIYSPPSVLTPTLRSRFQVSAARTRENLRNVTFRARETLQLSLSLGGELTPRELESAVSHACPRTRRDWWSSHTCCTWLPPPLSLFSISISISLTYILPLSWANTSYNRHPEKKCFEFISTVEINERVRRHS